MWVTGWNECLEAQALLLERLRVAEHKVTLGGGFPGDHNGRRVAELKATSMILRRSEGPVTFAAKKLQIADAIDVAIAAITKEQA